MYSNMPSISAMLSMALAASVLAVPLNKTLTPTPTLVNHAFVVPPVGPGFLPRETPHIVRGYEDAVRMARSVLSWSEEVGWFDPIFVQYFGIEDREFVLDVFAAIAGGREPFPKPAHGGNPLLAGIEVVVDFESEESPFQCAGEGNEGVTAVMDTMPGDPPVSKIILCTAGLKYGAIDTHQDGVNDVNCDTLDPRVSWKMDTLGSTLLHEFTHAPVLMESIFSHLGTGQDSTDDVENGYGPVKVRFLRDDPAQARINADSYTWLANEVWWTGECKATRGNDLRGRFEGADPRMGDDKPPYTNF